MKCGLISVVARPMLLCHPPFQSGVAFVIDQRWCLTFCASAPVPNFEVPLLGVAAGDDFLVR